MRPEPYAPAPPMGSHVELWTTARGKRQYRIRVSEHTHPDALDDLLDRALAAADKLDRAEPGPLARRESAG